MKCEMFEFFIATTTVHWKWLQRQKHTDTHTHTQHIRRILNRHWRFIPKNASIGWFGKSFRFSFLVNWKPFSAIFFLKRFNFGNYSFEKNFNIFLEILVFFWNEFFPSNIFNSLKIETLFFVNLVLEEGKSFKEN